MYFKNAVRTKNFIRPAAVAAESVVHFDDGKAILSWVQHTPLPDAARRD